MKKIISILQPFELEQKIFVYEDGNKIDAQQVRIDDLPVTILELANKYQISQIDLLGPKQYSRGICSKIKNQAVALYQVQSQPLEINVR